MKRMTILLACLACLTLLALPALAQDKLYVASEGAKLKSDKSASSDTVAELAVGTELKVSGAEESWYKVQAGGKSGWIYRGKVATSPPEPSQQGGNLFGSSGSNIQVSEADSARSMRGLSEQEAAKAAGRPTRPAAEYKQALDKILAEKVDKKELENFLKTGHIGEYAK